MSLKSAIVVAAIGGDKLYPQMTASSHYKHWISVQDWRRCLECANLHVKIWLISENPDPKPKKHPNCRCVIKIMQSITAGTATIKGVDGADWSLMFRNNLPNYYVSQKDLEFLGWRRGDKISKFTNEKMLFGGIYINNNYHLPQIAGRVV